MLQTEWQCKLLEKFESTLLIDSTFDTSKYQLPLFEVVIFTNVGYSPVGIFITEDETEDCVTEGLKILKSWHSGDWNPTTTVTDCDTAQSNALHTVFPGS